MERQIDLKQLPRYYAPLAQALTEAGVPSSQLDDIFASAIRARCLECGIDLTGADLGEVARAEETVTLASPKLDRLRLGYCARNRCECRYYVLRFNPVPVVNWAQTLARADALLASSSAEVPAKSAPQLVTWSRDYWRALQPSQKRQLGLLAGLMVIFLAIQWYRSGARLPLLSPKPREFIVEGAPDQSGSTRPGPPPPSTATNAPRQFLVR